MLRAKFKVEPYYEFPVCDCGEIISHYIGICKDDIMMAEFRCLNCGITHFLKKEDWPDVKYKILERINE